MTVDEIRKKKRKHIAEKPSHKQAAFNYDLYNVMMEEWALKLDDLIQQERALVEEEQSRDVEIRGKIAYLQRRKGNRLAMIDMLTAEFRRIGLDRRFNKDTRKALQWELAQRIVDLETEAQEFADEADALVEQLVNRL